MYMMKIKTFDGTLGEFQGLQHLEVDPQAKPVIMPDRRTPIAIRPQLKEELEKMVKEGVIAPVTEPTPWVSQIVVNKKKQGGLRICIDPTAATMFHAVVFAMHACRVLNKERTHKNSADSGSDLFPRRELYSVPRFHVTKGSWHFLVTYT